MELIDILGLTHTQMADWLRVSRSQIAMNKSNMRGLTGKPLRKLSDLQLLVDNLSGRKNNEAHVALAQSTLKVMKNRAADIPPFTPC